MQNNNNGLFWQTVYFIIVIFSIGSTKILSEETFMDCNSESDASAQERSEQIGDDEKKHFHNTVSIFRNYRSYYLKKLLKTTKYVSSLPAHQQQLLKQYKATLGKMRTSIEHNYEIIKLILDDVAHMFDSHGTIETENMTQTFLASHCEMEKVQSVLKQIHREWSQEGGAERDATFGVIINEILDRFPNRSKNTKILVPGAGLGRLPYEIAKLGYASQGNEYSLHMLFASNFILNKCKDSNLFRFYPFATTTINNRSSADQLRQISFPDVNPSEVNNKEFSMAAGNFLDIYPASDSWDCVATSFFIDTANNVLDYIETIWRILKPGGFWINVGPLLYHHADLATEDSIEPSYEEIKHIIKRSGFEYCKEDTNISTSYCHDPRSILRYEYKSIFFVCQKVNIGDKCV